MSSLSLSVDSPEIRICILIRLDFVALFSGDEWVILVGTFDKVAIWPGKNLVIDPMELISRVIIDENSPFGT